MTRDLVALRGWLAQAGVTHVGMEGRFDLIVGNARHLHDVPGRKTHVKEAGWMADLVRHGLVAKSFVPPRPQRDRRAPTVGFRGFGRLPSCLPTCWRTCATTSPSGSPC